MLTSPVNVPFLNCTRPIILEFSSGVMLPHVSSVHWASLPTCISTRAGEEIRMVKRHGLHIVHPIDRNATARFIFFVLPTASDTRATLPVSESMPLVGRQVQHIRAVYARFLEHPIGQIVPCRSIDGDAISRRVSQWHTAVSAPMPARNAVKFRTFLLTEASLPFPFI